MQTMPATFTAKIYVLENMKMNKNTIYFNIQNIMLARCVKNIYIQPTKKPTNNNNNNNMLWPKYNVHELRISPYCDFLFFSSTPCKSIKKTMERKR